MKRQLILRGLVLFILSLSAVYLTDFAHANEITRIIKQKKCRFVLDGGKWEVGDVIQFRGINRGRKIERSLRIVKAQPSARRYLARLEKRAKASRGLCRAMKGLSFDPARKFISENAPSYLDLRVAAGYTTLSSRGLSLLKPETDLVLPTSVGGQFGIGYFPSLSEAVDKEDAGRRYFGLSFWGSYGMTPASKGFEDESRLTFETLSLTPALAVRLWVLGDLHETVLRVGFQFESFLHKIETEGETGLALHRNLECSGPLVGLEQDFQVTESFVMSLFGSSGFVQSCRGQEVTIEQAIDLEVIAENPESLTAGEIAADAEYDQASLLAFGGSLGFRFSSGFGVQLWLKAQKSEGNVRAKTRRIPYRLTQNELALIFEQSIR